MGLFAFANDCLRKRDFLIGCQQKRSGNMLVEQKPPRLSTLEISCRRHFQRTLMPKDRVTKRYCSLSRKIHPTAGGCTTYTVMLRSGAITGTDLTRPTSRLIPQDQQMATLRSRLAALIQPKFTTCARPPEWERSLKISTG